MAAKLNWRWKFWLTENPVSDKANGAVPRLTYGTVIMATCVESTENIFGEKQIDLATVGLEGTL